MELRLAYIAVHRVRLFVIALLVLLPPVHAFADDAVDNNEQLRQYSNLLNTIIYQWNAPNGLNNKQLTELINNSGIIEDTSTVATVVKAVMYEMSASDVGKRKLPINKPSKIASSQWHYLKTLDVSTYAAMKAYFIIAKNANQYSTPSERLQQTIPTLHSLKQEVIQTGSEQAVAIVSMWLAMEYSELNSAKAIVELEYALPHLEPYDEYNSLETALDTKLAHAWLAEAYMQLNSPYKALKHNHEIIDQQRNNGLLDAFNYAGAIDSLNRLARYNEALELLKDADMVAQKNDSLQEAFFVLMMRVGVYVNRLAPGDKKLISKLTKDLSKYEGVKLPEYLIVASQVLKVYYTAINGTDATFEHAVDDYISFIDRRISNGYYNKPIVLNKSQTLRDIHKLRGNFEKAFFYQQQYQRLLVQPSTTLENEENAVNDSPLERDIVISKLQKLARQKDQQNLRLETQKFQALAFALFAVLIATLLFGFYRAQRKRALRGERDDLTGAMTRNAMFKAIAKPMATNITSCMVLIDFDYFKQINNRYGHVVGDEVLSTFGTLVSRHLSKADRFCRYGGEEFLLYLHDANEHTAAARLIALKDAMEAHDKWTATESRFSASFSAGVVEVTEESNITTIIKVCDHLLYKAKSSGRGKIETLSLSAYFNNPAKTAPSALN